MRSRIRTAAEAWRTGRRLGYPPCCVALFCTDQVLGLPSAAMRADQLRASPDGGGFVACGLVHPGACEEPVGRRAGWVVRGYLGSLPASLRSERQRAAAHREQEMRLRHHESDACSDLDPSLDWV